MNRQLTPLLLLLTLACSCGGAEVAEDPSPASEADDSPASADAPSAVEDDLTCHPVSRCQCWAECALLRVGSDYTVRMDSEGEERFAPGEEGHEACDVDGRCGPGFDSTTAACDETCAPSRATFTCRRDLDEPTDPTGRPCVRVELAP